MSYRIISKKDFKRHLAFLKERFGEIKVFDNPDGTKTVMAVATHKHLGTFRVRKE